MFAQQHCNNAVRRQQYEALHKHSRIVACSKRNGAWTYESLDRAVCTGGVVASAYKNDIKGVVIICTVGHALIVGQNLTREKNVIVRKENKDVCINS